MPEEKISSSSNNPYGATVYIWNTTRNAVGHAAIEVVACATADGSDAASKYVSIHPGGIPSVGPTVVFPLPAALSRTLHEDKMIEANYHKPQVPDANDPGVPFRTNEIVDALSPDRILHIEHLDTKAMLSEIDSIVSKVDSGEVQYQLFPKVNTLRFFKEIPHYITYNPVDSAILRDSKPQATASKEPVVYNCATLVAHLLQKGGMPMNVSKKPWGLSPNELSETIQESPSYKKG